MDIWHFTTLVGILTMLLGVGLKLQKRILFVPWLYFSGSSALSAFSLSMGAITPFDLALKYSGAKVLAALTLFVLYFQTITPVQARILRRIVYLVLALDAVWLLAGGDGLMVGYTQDTLVMAFLLPLIFVDRAFRWLIPLYLACILWSFGKGAFIVLGVESAILFLFMKDKKVWSLVGFLGSLLFIYTSATKMIGARWTVVWREHLKWWGANADQWTGAGPGSFEWVSKLQIPVHTEGPKMWLHGDWLQIMFEYGLIGLALALAVYGYVLVKFFKARHEFAFASWVGIGLGMCVYSPVQFWFVQVFIAMAIVHASSIRQVPIGYPVPPHVPLPKCDHNFQSTVANGKMICSKCRQPVGINPKDVKV